MAEASAFLFTTCQVGAERALKAEMERLWPAFHFAYSRTGFLTFKLPAGHALADDFELGAVFARAHGFSLGKIALQNPEQAPAEFWKLAGAISLDRLHVWQRDSARPGYRGFEPSISPAARDAEEALRSAYAAAHADDKVLPVEPTKAGQLVLDCVLVEPHEWWAGFHRARAGASCWPGGLPPIELPVDAVSRAWLKMTEALLWSEFPVKPGDAWVEIGCSPGGASSALLNRGVSVTGIDPAAVDPRVLEHPKFTHIRKRGADVRRREYRHFRWLAADMNVAPNYTLDTVEAIVTYPSVNFRGLLLTLKLLDWELAAEIPQYLERIASWGFRSVRARQLANNRQEICVAAATGRSAPQSPRAGAGKTTTVGQATVGRAPVGRSTVGRVKRTKRRT